MADLGHAWFMSGGLWDGRVPPVDGCPIVASPGLSWALLGSPGLSWALLGSPGLSWVHSGFTGLVWILSWSMWSYSDYDL